MQRVAVLSLHTSPLAQPGTGDGGGMNVYVRELCSAVARAGLECDVYTRAWRRGLAPTVSVEPGFRVHHVPAGPVGPVPLEDGPGLVGQFTDGVLRHLVDGVPDLIHANYWLSGAAGHTLKHQLELPLVSTFHTLARAKVDGDAGADGDRAKTEEQVVGCSDAILASSAAEREQLVHLYGADPARVEIVPPGVDHDVFSPGDRHAARRSLGLGDGPVLLFVGRIQPLKGAGMAIEAVAQLAELDPTLVVVGGPSGPEGGAELRRLRQLVRSCGVERNVRFVAPRPHHELAAYYRAADACLVPSSSESFGLVALEAAACGTPVVAAAVGGLATNVDHGRTGFLVDRRDPASYAAHSRALLESPVLAQRMSAAAAAWARRFSWSITAARLRRLYADLVQRSLVECQ